ncbi:hypothetical protein K450DRAFT_228787 [Umbelopsis ramanniana AG]|uniref:Uncharacterized protein n=1 Tax=Umbelopsis ramanniana AG TaxID=1314678 RepID=A0AAD5HF54_UMBRA|nr:uncharacterized protein K450DRAFT_228787 [Umbelopsis ramanniana AG]KAI8582047.1 hypothetical protein K450DRAFT_228787 [Umbelopsis ramanniana AG]
MYKLSILAILFTASVALSCDKACSFVSEANGQCTFSCVSACHQPAPHHRNAFLSGLAQKGHNCRASGITSVTCPAQASLGNCRATSWTCGRGC